MTLKVLEHIGNAVIDVADLTMGFLESGYGASPWQIMGAFERRQIKRSKRHEEKLSMKRSRQRFYSMLHRLKKDNLIEAMDENKKFFQLTSKGKRYLQALKKRRIDALPDNSYGKHDSKSSKFTIIVFDIPESEKRKRAWLRLALRNLGFQLIQKSVWAGKVKIPRQFLDDLRDLRLVEYVEIFEISKSGSLQQLT